MIHVFSCVLMKKNISKMNKSFICFALFLLEVWSKIIPL